MALFSVITNFRTTLAQGMTISQLTSVLASATVQGHVIVPADYGSVIYLTINPGAANMEVVRASTNSGTTFTLDKRGLAWYGDGDTELSPFKFAHNAGEPVIVSNVKNVYDQLVDRWSDETIGGIKTFEDLPTIPLTPVAAEDAASKGYVDTAVSLSSGVTALLTSKNGSNPTLTVNVNSGDFIVDGAVITFAGASAQAVTAASTNYVQVTFAGALVINTTGFITGNIPLATVVADGTTITSVTDKRPFFTMDIEKELIDTSFTYGATLSALDPLRVDATASNKLIKALATTAANADGFVGVAIDAGVDTNTNKRVLIAGRVTGLSGLTPDAAVYLTDAGGFSPTPGTYKKQVGWATTSTTMILTPTVSPAGLSGTTSDVTAASLNAAAAFFATPFKQPIKTTVTAGHDLAQGEVVAWESDGKAYRTRPKGFSTSNAGVVNNQSSTEIGQEGKMYWFDTASENVKAFLGIDTDSTNHFATWSVVTDNAFDAISTVTVADEVPTALSANFDAIQHNSNTQVTICYSDGAGVEAVSVDALTSTPVYGSPLVLDAAAVGAGMVDTSAAGILIAFAGTNSQADLTSFKITFVGTTLTESTNATLITGGASVRPRAAGRFTGTDFIAVAYENGGSGFLIIAQYNTAAGTWTSVGSPIAFGGGNGDVFLVPLSATKMAACVDSSGDLVAYMITRSTVTPTLSSPVNIVTTITATTPAMSFKKLGKYTFLASAETTGGGISQIIAADRDYTTFSLVGSPITNGSTSDRGIAGCLLIPNRWLAAYQSAATTGTLGTREFSTNLPSMIGVIEAATVTDATEEVITNGYSDDFTGLTAGSAHYSAIDGQVTTSASGRGPITTNANAVGVVKRVVSAVSTTDGVVNP